VGEKKDEISESKLDCDRWDRRNPAKDPITDKARRMEKTASPYPSKGKKSGSQGKDRRAYQRNRTTRKGSQNTASDDQQTENAKSTQAEPERKATRH